MNALQHDLRNLQYLEKVKARLDCHLCCGKGGEGEGKKGSKKEGEKTGGWGRGWEGRKK